MFLKFFSELSGRLSLFRVDTTHVSARICRPSFGVRDFAGTLGLSITSFAGAERIFQRRRRFWAGNPGARTSVRFTARTPTPDRFRAAS